jgi:hypothetical protein
MEIELAYERLRVVASKSVPLHHCSEDAIQHSTLAKIHISVVYGSERLLQDQSLLMYFLSVFDQPLQQWWWRVAEVLTEFRNKDYTLN